MHAHNFEEHNPHALLGLHALADGTKIIRLYRPGAKNAHLEVKGQIVEAFPAQKEGFFEYVVPAATTARDYRIYHQNGLLAHDPYAFLPTIGDLDQYLFNKGVHYQLFNVMGAKRITHEGIEGVRFTVWAPSAKQVSLVADFNYFDGREIPCAVWALRGFLNFSCPD